MQLIKIEIAFLFEFSSCSVLCRTASSYLAISGNNSLMFIAAKCKNESKTFDADEEFFEPLLVNGLGDDPIADISAPGEIPSFESTVDSPNREPSNDSELNCADKGVSLKSESFS